MEKLWDAIVARFTGRKKTEENLAAIGKVVTVLDGEFVEDEAFEARLKALAQQIVNIQSHLESRSRSKMKQDISGQGKGYQFRDIDRIDHVGDRYYDSDGPRKVVFQNCGGTPPSFDRYWIDRTSYQSKIFCFSVGITIACLRSLG